MTGQADEPGSPIPPRPAGSFRLVHIVDDVPELDRPSADGAPRRLTMVVALDGFLDAGQAAALAATTLADSAEGRVVASFDLDQLYDYRARRPGLSFVRDHYQDYDAPRLVVRLLHDAGGTAYLLLTGPEPDFYWEAFIRGVREIVERFGVTRVVGMGSVPMAVPHTRPIQVTPHANNPELVTAESRWSGELRIPSSAQALLELRLGEWGHDAMGFVAHVPHYLTQFGYPQAAVSLLEEVEKAGGILIDLSELREAAVDREAEIAHHVDTNAEVAEVVRGLEEQYDAFERAQDAGASLLAEGTALPTGDEIGELFEQFLAGLDGPDGPDGGADRDANRD
ncbi:MAG: PAC2 family protein [Nocardioides sp.]